MTKTKDHKGPISVNDDITPITKKPITQVDSNEWSKLSVTELWEQRTVINNRLDYALQLGHTDMIKQIQTGLHLLDQIIDARSASTDDTRLI